MAPRLRGAKRKKLVQLSSYRRHSGIVQLRSMFRIIFKEASNNYPWLEWVKSGLFPENFFSSARLNFSFSFQRNSTTVRHTATCWRLFNQWRDPAVHFSLLQYLLLSLFFFCLSLSNRQVRVISTLLDAIVNLCFARSPRAEGSNFRTCAIAACPGFRDSPLMRMSMNRTLPDLPFACPGRSGYEISPLVNYRGLMSTLEPSFLVHILQKWPQGLVKVRSR